MLSAILRPARLQLRRHRRAVRGLPQDGVEPNRRGRWGWAPGLTGVRILACELNTEVPAAPAGPPQDFVAGSAVCRAEGR